MPETVKIRVRRLVLSGVPAPRRRAVAIAVERALAEVAGRQGNAQSLKAGFGAAVGEAVTSALTAGPPKTGRR